MRLRFFRRSAAPDDVLRNLRRGLKREFRGQLRHVRSLPARRLSPRLHALDSLASLRSEVEAPEDVSTDELSARLEQWTSRMLAERAAGRIDDVLFGRTLLRLAHARQRLNDDEQPSVHRVLISSEVLFELHQLLFPAERMAVIAGRLVAGQLMLSACFDVTSREVSSVAYTRAEPGRLAHALLAMERSGTRLAAWAHSHPGETAGATCPSDIDRRQWAAWSEDYDELLGLIFTHDGHVRLWGEAVEAKRLGIRLCGTGYREVGSHVYQLNL